MFSDPCRRPIASAIRRCASAALAIALLTFPASLAKASPTTPDPLPSGASAGNCPLTRVGTQFVRCDNLTGAGVSAPPWVPELASGRATHTLDPC
jgi:hypothetical protein